MGDGFLLCALPFKAKSALGFSEFSDRLVLGKVDSKPLNKLEKSFSTEFAVLGISNGPEGNTAAQAVQKVVSEALMNLLKMREMSNPAGGLWSRKMARWRTLFCSQGIRSLFQKIPNLYYLAARC